MSKSVLRDLTPAREQESLMYKDVKYIAHAFGLKDEFTLGDLN